ncbi:MAG: hypothetical protein ACK57S_02345 [Brevundimonas sp.]|jgi:hypothetical protein|uniref:hypothetical protein n=1 Tax=Brevundimonas sp. TaxID=1871086 RepID=UPI00391F4FAB
MSAVPIDHPALSRHRLRQQLTVLVEKAIAILDALDGDADDEPSLAHPEVAHWQSQALSLKALPLGGPEVTDLEEACEDEGMIDEDAEHDGREPEDHD